MAQEKIFINYRRSDSRADAGRLYDRLASRFPGRVFRDVASLEPGMEWKEAITGVLGQAGACIVVIGRDWISSADAAGRRRLDDPQDTVRQELAVALERKMRVFPVLVGGARMPAEEELPPDIQSLCRRNALEITEQDWDEDVSKLLKALETSLGLPQQPLHVEQHHSSPRKAWLFPVLGSVAVLLLVLGLYSASRDSSFEDLGGPSALTQPGSLSGASPIVGQRTNADLSNSPDLGSRLIGSWKANVFELGVPVEIIWNVWPNGTSSYTFTSGLNRATDNATWTYSDGLLLERSSMGFPGSASIKWIDNNHFVLTIIDNGDPRTRGMERHYSRLG